MEILTIMIPTYNRADFLYRNVTGLCRMIRDHHLEEEVRIDISNNASTDSTKEIMNKLKVENETVHLTLNHNEDNKGISGNLMVLLGRVNSEYAMTLGDDDFIDERFLTETMRLLKSGIGCIVPSYQNVTTEMEEMKRGRDVGKKVKQFKKGFYNCFINSWRAHQISGLIFKVDDLYQRSKESGLENLYLMMYWIAEACLHHSTVHLTTYPIRVVRPAQTSKAWSYGKDGLVGEIFQNYKAVSEINYLQRSLLELKLLYAQYWRYAMYLKVGIPAFLQCVWNIMRSDNTTYVTKVLFPFFIPVVAVCQTIQLLFSGKLIDVLKTKVEV